MNKRQSLKQKTNIDLSTMNAFYFYLVEQQDNLKRIYPVMTDLQIEKIIIQSWFLLSESERMKYEFIRQACVTSQFQQQAQQHCNEFGIRLENLKDIYLKESEKLTQMYIPLEFSKEEYADNSQRVEKKLAVNYEQYIQTRDTVEVLERVLNLKMKPYSQNQMQRANTQPLNFQINYCSSSRQFMLNANLIKDLIISANPNATVEVYPIGGKTGDIIIYYLQKGQNTPIWSCLVDGSISSDDNQSFMRVLQQIQEG